MAAAPLLAVAAFAVLVLALTVAPGPGAGEMSGRHLAVVALGGLALAAACLWQTEGVPTESFSGALRRDGLSMGFGGLSLGAAAIACLLALAYVQDQRLAAGEFFALILLGTAGMLLVAMAGSTVVLFLGIEIMSLAAYVLAGYRQEAQRSAEAALKYFIFGAFASAFLLMGIALLYGETGLRPSGRPSFLLSAVAEIFAQGPSALGLFGAGLVMAGLAFKLAAVPFHMWAPDVYEGAPTPVAAFMAVGIKAAAVAAMCRVVGALMPATGAPEGHLLGALEGLACLTMLVGNLLAMRQSQVKRMLAYSSVAHAGYLLLGVLALAAQPSGNAQASIVFYLIAYGAMTSGAFAVVMAWERHGERSGGLSLEGMAGVAHRHPGMGLAMTLFLVALAGLPPTGGFVAKAGLFMAAIDAGHISVVVLAALCSCLGAAAYLRVLVSIWLPRGRGATPCLTSPWLSWGVGLCVLVVLGTGILPGLPVEATRRLLAAWP